VADIEIPDPDEAKEKAENPFTRRVALFVAIYAVALALAAAGGGGAGMDMLMEQQKATNKWGQYQAKAIREALYLNEAEKLEMEIARGNLTGDAQSLAKKSLDRIRGKLDEYKGEKKEIMDEAKGHEAKRDDAQRRDPYFEYAEMGLQIAIVLASVAMLSGKRWAFYASLVLAAGGAGLTANGYFLFDGGKVLGGG
jgi:Domain of unknown function (DUF4337)